MTIPGASSTPAGRFDAGEAFARNLGWVTGSEQLRLRASRVAIAGLGGVGGAHLLTLARLGVGSFSLADPDRFELANLNRQAGASLSTIGRAKVDVLAAMARDIDPGLALRLFPGGVDADNVDAFLDGVDLYVDGLDFFAFDARAAVFSACERRGIPAITAAPLGMGAALLVFVPGGMGFERYFRWDGCDDNQRALRFLVGLAPAVLHARYLVDPSAVDLAARRGPSTAMACQLCAGIAGTEALKLLLGRGPLTVAPRGLQFDAYRQRLRFTWRPAGNANPLQRLLIAIAARRYRGQSLESTPPGIVPAPPRWRGLPLDAVPQLLLAAPPAGVSEPWGSLLELARWAPSGDNTQPWRFEIVDARRALLHGFDTRHWCVYDIDGWPSRLAIGGLLETLRIAAAAGGRRLRWRMREDAVPGAPVVELELDVGAAGPRAGSSASIDGAAAAAGAGDEPGIIDLAAQITRRSVQRRGLSMRPLSPQDRHAIEAAVASCGDFDCLWFESVAQRAAIGSLLSLATRIRLRLASAWRTHARVLAWDARFSEDRIPDRALGLDRFSLRLLRWALASERRALFVARYLGGAWWPQWRLDRWPAIACAGHLAIARRPQPASGEPSMAADFALGAAMQRAWLTAEARGLRMQPEMAVPIFAEYGMRDASLLHGDPGLRRDARRLAAAWRALPGLGDRPWDIWLCRLGFGPAATARSLRRPLALSPNPPADAPAFPDRKEFP
jgi:molybdopterin/thiamine biosynthesis adenylyltransferase/nitroreductase